MKKAYYDLQARFRPGWCAAHPKSIKISGALISGWTRGGRVDPASWERPPHVAFANLDALEKKQVIEFMATYGPIGLQFENVESSTGSKEFDASMIDVREKQGRLRLAWRDRDAKGVWLSPGFEEWPFYDLPLMWLKRDEFRIPGVWTYMRLLLTRDIATGRARSCKNKSCKTPYFIANRSDAEDCSQTCASAAAVRRFRKKGS